MTAETKGLSLNEMRARVAKFAVDYRDVTSEKQNSGDFWRAFMRCYGVEDTFQHGVMFERPARRSDTGGQGYIDVFWPGKFLVEQKSHSKIKWAKGSETSNAEEQAAAYIAGGDISKAEMPRWVVTSDFASIQVTDLAAAPLSPVRTKTVRTEDLVDHVELFLFLSGQDGETLIAAEQAEASVAAAGLMGDLYAAMTGDTNAPEVETPEEEDAETLAASVLLTRLLFLMFGDDAGLWSKGLFLRFVETRTVADGSDLGAQLASLFDVLDTPEPRGRRVDEALSEFPYVNGDLFKRDGAQMTYFDTAMRDALLAACRFDWSRISPAVFGSLFQTVKSRDARRAAGEHYTSEANILKVLRPMFLDGLRARLDAANTKPALERLHADLKDIRYVDPACGCGNFLIVAYREMRALELDLLVKLRTKRGTGADLMLDPSDLLHVRLDQFHGVELYWWPAKIAETAMFLVDHQANQQMAKVLGFTPNRLPIDIAARIVHANAMTTDWDTALPDGTATVFMFGNPPFVGTKERTAEQTAQLADVWGDGYSGFLDFVTAWHRKALRYMASRPGEFGFVTTNSVTQGTQPVHLFGAVRDAGWRVKFAHRTFPWDSESAAKDRAAVHCVIVGFTRDKAVEQVLYDYPNRQRTAVPVKVTTGINGYLVDAPDVFITTRRSPLAPQLPEVSAGSKAVDWGFLTVEADQHACVAADPVMSKYLRRFIGGEELINGLDRWCLWLVDLDPHDLHASPALRARIREVRTRREASRKEPTRRLAQTPHLFGERYQPAVAYLGIPQTFSENRLFATADRLDADVVASMKLFTCPDPDGFAFAVVSSSMFITWQKTIGGRLKSDPSFSNTLVWNNLPLPAVEPVLRDQMVAAGRGVLDARALHPDRTLAGHYQPLGMDPDLVRAHRALDRIVDKAFGGPGRRRSVRPCCSRGTPRWPRRSDGVRGVRSRVVSGRSTRGCRRRARPCPCRGRRLARGSRGS